ncbi:centrosome-associated protein 350-like isoform X1 [Neodiprion fabricii]|uniref:centrosome-associated protein 350-like isoform X1 n=1 Tax=Neodiprion fabricii TaxID=2872261 RepID=UPI001ED92EC0|nr:centrosome-associated protein 350-like isoform X1 [Neodiprion fabricii]
MKSNINKEETDTKKKYVFFTDPDVIVRRAESSAAASQALQSFKINEQLRQSNPNVNQSEAEGFSNLQTKSDIKGLETLLTYHPVQPYPFTFITAVKRKLALNMHAEACKRAYEPENLDKPQTDRGANNTNTDFKRSINQVVQKMDFIKPLKVPDLKISPKTLDYSFQTAGGFGNKKFDIHRLDEQVSPACNKLPKSAEKVHRKLDFSVLEGSQSKNCENIEPLKIPDLSIGSSSTKKKEHIRDSSREKENRSKRIKKDDLALARQDDSLKETPRRSKLSKHVSRKDAEESADSVLEMLRSENFLSSLPRESDFALKKPKSKNFITSTVKKSDDKKPRSVSMQALRSSRERSSETKTKNSENDSSSENNMKIHERITLRDNFKGKSTENLNDVKYKNPELLNCKQQKHATKLPSQGQPKQFENHPKSQIRQSYEKQKPSTTEMEFKDMIILDVSEEIKSACASSSKETEKQCRKDSSSKTDDIMRNETSLQQSKSSETSREAEQSDHSSQISTQMEKHHENSGNASSTDKFSSQSLNVDSKLTDNPINQVDSSTTSSQSKLNSEYINPQSKSFSEIILDPARISFRDESYGEQNEFCDLVTPDINLLLRSKRRKNFSHKSDSENDLRSPKHKPANNVQAEDNGIQLLHPTALHMQFQAELRLLDSFNESLWQVMNVEKQKENEMRRKNLMLLQAGRDTIDAERHQENQSKADQETIEKTGDLPPHHINETNDPNVEVMNTSNENPNIKSVRTPARVKHSQDKTLADSDNFLKKNDRTSVRVTEVQTQTANDIATQTDTHRVRRRYISPARQIPGITYERETSDKEEIPQLSFESLNQFEDFDQIENVSLPSRMHTMSEISLHETTSSIKTETGTEISISTRDVTCSFNKYLDSELAQLIKDEKQRFDEIEMLFKSREKTLNDRTKKLVKLEEQKRALRDMGQDSRISSVKKKQRALLLKLQQEKDEMNRLKELHKKASQERKLMLQKQRNMLNPQMSTKNILTKLKRSADNQSPRRLSGPMKGYDIRSPSSMSSLLDSDKSQLDRSHMEMKSHGAEGKLHKYEGKMPRSDIASSQEGQDTRLIKANQFDNMTEPSDTSFIDCNILSPDSQKFLAKEQKIHSAAQNFDAKLKYETKPCKYKEVMPKLDILHHKLHGTDIESNISSKKLSKQDILTGLEKPKVKELQPKSALNELDKSICDNVKSESDTLVDEVSKKSKSSQATEINFENLKLKREKELLYQKNPFVSENLNTESDDIAEELGSRQSKSSHIVEDISEMTSKSSKKTQNTSMISKESSKKSQNSSKIKSNSKRKGSRSLKSKSSSDILSENIMRSKSSSQIPEEIMKYHSKRSKMEKDEAQSEEDFENLLTDLEANESQSSLHALVKHSKAVKEKNYQILKNIANEHEAKENVPSKDSENMRSISGRQDGNFQNVGNMSTRSQVSTLTISHHSSGESEKSYSRSVVIRAQDHHFRTSKKLDQILSAREAALASRRSCVEKWIAWHSRLRAEENRVTRMEEAMIKLVSGTHNAVSYHDTTISSDTSDVESRIEMLAEKLAERRTEMTRLKREAKRQAKQRLKALETNLLNQIKKYDTTIHEMRKKLENKRGAVANDGLSDKLAIESKSLTDFKIPEIPIKRIKEIYKNSDLLKSRSESEIRGLMSDDNQHKDLEMYGSENSKRISSYKKSPRSATSDVTDRSEMISAKRKAETESTKSIFEHVKSTASKEPDITSDYIGNQSISEQIEESNRASNLRSSSERSIDEISIVSSQCKSDSSRKELQLSQHKEIRNEGITSGPSRASSNREPDSIPESIETTTSLQEVQSKPMETVTDVEYSRCYSISIQPSISKDIPTEILSDLEKRNHRSIVECNSSPHATSDGETISDYMLEEISQRDDKNVSISESQQLISSKRILTKITDSEVQSDTSPSEVHLIKNSSIDNVTDGLISVTSRSTSGQNAPQIILDEALTTKGRSDIDEDVLEESVQESESISNKLSFLELGNKNLNDDISTLENDLKALSEMMSQFSKSSDNKSKSDKEEKVVGVLVNDSDKGTSTDITDLDHPNNFSDQELMFNSNKNATYIVDEERENVDFNEKDLNAQVSEIMQKIVPEDTALRTYSEQEIDFKARSREILNEIEKSIISDHVKSPDRVDINTKSIEINASFEENKDAEAINHLNSLKNDIMSIAEIISNSSEAKKDFTLSGSLECDNLLEDADAIEACSNSHPHAFEEPVVLEQFVEKESLEKPASKMPDECNLKEDSFQTSNETNRPVHSLNDNIEIVSSKNITETPPTELLETNFEHSDQKSTFETIKDPEYEDISEESLEISEIMDKSERQRSERELYQKSSRLPEKYQMTQKSEDVLRILDEITQKTNQASQKSQQFLITPENNGKKIGELLQKSEQLCKNFQALTSIPRRSDAEFELPITESHIPNKRFILQTKVTSEQPEQILNESGFPQQINIPEKTNQTAHEQKTEYISHDIETEISSIPSDKPETSSSVAVESHSTKSLDELETGQIRNKEDPDKFGTCQTKFTRESTKLDISMHQTDIQHQNDKESVVETRMFIGNLVDTYNPIERLKIPCQHDESQIFDTKISADIGLPDADVKSYKAQGYSTKEESTQQIQEESVDTASQKFDNLSDKSIKSVEIPEQISLIGETRILSESSEYDIVSHQSNLGSANEQLKQNLIITKLSEDTGLGDDNDDKGKSYEELKKVKHLGNINVHVHTIEESSLIPLFGKSSLENVENKVDTLKLKHSDEQEPQITVEARANLENQCDEILQESFEKLDETRESNLQLQAINEPIHGLHAGFENSEESQNSADLLPELIHSEKSRDILHKSDIADKSDCASQKSDESQVSGKSEDNLQKYEVELPSESSEEAETPRSVSEIEIDSPRDPNDSRLDIEALDDDLLANENNSETKNIKLKNEFNATPVIATSEKDIEAMIDKLKVSLEQPGLEVAELEAKLLRIQELQIELEIKKLEAEEVSYYVREIPNKPPPPYTPPSGGRLSISQTSPSTAPAVVPTNVEDLTSFTERATHLIYQAKKSGDDIISLQLPTEICELSKDNNETARRDRKIYNTFLFDLCKETISEVYQSECEKPGPSWLKPNAKTKPAMKIPTTVEGLNDYVSKEVATLFGFKTKLQRENLVMRWSRKRRDRVDELLAREAQAEEDEWTKFHHDELAVKNELTTAILDSLILDAANVVKMAYIKKRQVTS